MCRLLRSAVRVLAAPNHSHPYAEEIGLVFFLGVVIAFGGGGFLYAMARRATRRVGVSAPQPWSPTRSFSGALSVNHFFLNVPGTARLELSRDFVRLKAFGFH